MPCDTLGPMPKKVSRERWAVVSGRRLHLALGLLYLHERRLGEIDVGDEGLCCVSTCREQLVGCRVRYHGVRGVAGGAVSG